MTLVKQIHSYGWVLIWALTLFHFADVHASTADSTPSASRQRAASLLKRAIQRRRAAKAASQPKSLADITKDVDMVADTLSDAHVHQFLRKAALINVKMLNIPKCVMVEKAGSGDAGSFTENLFYVFYYPSCDPRKGKKLLFVIKELKQKSAEEELYNLHLLQNSAELRALGGVRNANFPQITFSEDFYRFRTPAGEPKYILLIHGARGRSLNDIYKGNAKEYDAVAAFRTFGRVLGHFNHAFLRGNNCLLKGGNSLKACVTINHGDLHPKNVFYDGTYIYFIDTETLARSLHQRTPLALDLIYFYNMPVYLWTRRLSPQQFHEREQQFGRLFRYARHAYIKVLTQNAVYRLKLSNFIKHFTQNRITGLSFIKTEHDFIRKRGAFEGIIRNTQNKA